MTIRIVVHGSPAPQGSKSFRGMSNAGRAILTESSKRVKPWRQDVKAAAEKFIETCTPARDLATQKDTRIVDMGGIFAAALPLDYALRVRMVFTLPKPASAPKRRITFPCKLPDLSKLVRSTEDALTDAGLWRDDARIVECTAAKRYPGEGEDALQSPGCVIEVEVIAQ